MNALKERTPGAVGIASRALREADAPIVADDANAIKRFATLRAQAALAGHTLERHIDAQGVVTYTMARWGWVREFADLASVANWLAGVTGEAPADVGRLERDRRELIDAANREQDRLDERADLGRGPGGER